MKAVSIFVLVLACLCLFAEAQLTFTSSWGGKRGAVAATMSCRSDETINAIYKLIQNEAERLLLCPQKP
ncbi:hypothetical protein B5X24_HaOG203400 [Helicoverpa armigera]|uniref:Adipokinetic 1 n=1 Tax=Helicoverpa armigera TaxID=29058 RepID=M4QEK5_HELAM|nr:adipokinetic 1 [Helicoverpa armigera]PZC77450.1 hypothetical protein B5X24_HaOG203400 [Helicoverpa armigera]WGD18896.1 adipokinetic hormone 1 [Helicoverpa armigera]